MFVNLFQTDSWSQFMIPLLSKYQSFLPDHAVFFAIIAMILNYDCCFNQSTIHFDHHCHDYYQWPNDHILNNHKWQWFQSTNHTQMMVWTRICSILIADWLLRIIKKIGFDSGTMEWFEWIDICWCLFTFVNPLINR